jgi:integrase
MKALTAEIEINNALWEYVKTAGTQGRKVHAYKAEQAIHNLRRNNFVTVYDAIQSSESHLRPHIIPKLGSIPLTEINTKAVQSFVAYLATGGRSKKPVENVLLTLSSILRTAKAWDYACGNFTLADITMPREGVKKEQRCFTDEEVGKILAAAPEPFGTILAVTAVLGLRIGEVLALRVSDIDFMRKIVRVRQSVDSATRNVNQRSTGGMA